MNKPNCISNEYRNHSEEWGGKRKNPRNNEHSILLRMRGLRQGMGERPKKKKKILNNL